MIDGYLVGCENLMKKEKYSEAINGFSYILKLDRTSIQAYRGMALSHSKLGNWAEALTYSLNGLHHGKNQTGDLALLLDILELSSLREYIVHLEAPLMAALKNPRLSLKAYNMLGLQIALKHNSVFSNFSQSLTYNKEIEQLIFDKSYCRLLEMSVVSDYLVEEILLVVRREVLKLASLNKDISKYLPFLTSLGCQTLLNDGLYYTSKEEALLLENINLNTDKIVRGEQPQQMRVEHLLLLLCYSSFEDSMAIWRNNEEILRSNGETNLVLDLEFYSNVLSSRNGYLIKRDTSKKVQSFYMENPYPKWKMAGFSSVEVAQDLKQYEAKIESIPAILIAGCGTGKQVIEIALCNPKSNILAIDITPTSIKYAQVMANKYGITNVEFKLLDILDLKELNKEFDYIICTGVLHHMASPEDGLNVLESVLSENGYMLLAFYSSAARRELSDLRTDLFSFSNVDESSITRELVKKWRRQLDITIKTSELSKTADFYFLNGLYDLLLHPQEKEYSLNEIRNMLGMSGLEYVKMKLKLNKRTELQAVLKRNPISKEGDTLDYWSDIEKIYPPTFINMYTFLVTRVLDR